MTSTHVLLLKHKSVSSEQQGRLYTGSWLA